jgi:phosphoribosylformylglycinamidine cyclo-ligase
MQKQSGVDINLGNQTSNIAFRYAMDTFPNRNGKKGAVASKTNGGFSNLLIFGNERIGIGSDGTGTKAELAERTGIYDTLGYDLVAMVADDLAAAGFEPTNLSNVIDVDFLDKNIINQMMKGLRDACNFAGMTITGGEIAELGNRISGYGNAMHFNWSATAIGVLPENLSSDIDGSKIKPGDVVISLKSRGFRSNGFSAIRRILQENFGDEWHQQMYDEQNTWGEKLLTPSLIYAPVITILIQKNLIPKGIAHITGGGIFDNLKRVLQMTGNGAVLDNLFEPLPEMLQVKNLGKISDDDAYLWWNMGNGMLLVVNPDDAETIIKEIRKNNYSCQIAGSITGNKEISAVFPTYKLTKKI